MSTLSIAENDPTPRPFNDPTNQRNLGILFLILAAFLLLCGACSALFYLIIPFTTRDRSEALQANTIFGSLVGLGVVLGGALAWQGQRAYRGKPAIAAARVFPRLFVFGLAFFGAILLGNGTLSFDLVAPYAFPPWHFLAGAAAPLAMVAYAAHRLGAASGARALLASITWGALAATTIAVTLELFALIVVIVIAAIFIAANPASAAALEELRQQLSRLSARGALETDILNNPLVTGGLWLYFGVIIPPIEEALKTLAVAFLDPRRTQSREAVLWGIGAGAGFALVENLFNGALSLTSWTAVAIIRLGATVMHTATGATMGRAWYAARVQGRWRRLALAYCASVFFHALWNTVAVVWSNRDAPLGSAAQGIALFVLSAAGAAWIVYLVRTNRLASVASTE